MQPHVPESIAPIGSKARSDSSIHATPGPAYRFGTLGGDCRHRPSPNAPDSDWLPPWPTPRTREDWSKVMPALQSLAPAGSHDADARPLLAAFAARAHEVVPLVAASFARACADPRTVRDALMALDLDRYGTLLPCEVTLRTLAGESCVHVEPLPGVPPEITALIALGLAHWLNQLAHPAPALTRVTLPIGWRFVDRETVSAIGVQVVLDCPITRLVLADDPPDRHASEGVRTPAAFTETARGSVRAARGAAPLEQRLVHALAARMGGAPLSARDLAQDLGMSERTLQRRLHELGRTFGEVLDAYRHSEAKLLLSGRRESIGDVARRLGFAEQSSFNRAFRRWTGLAPRAWVRSAVCDPPRHQPGVR